MSVTACAALTERADPDRFLATMAAPPDLRDRLWPIWAYNAEVARAPWVTQETGIAEIRLQWWRDAVAGMADDGPVRQHEVVVPLAAVVRARDIPADLLDGIVAARRWDIYTDPFEDTAHFREHLDRTAGNLMWAAALACSAEPSVEADVRRVAFAQGLANWFLAVPALEAAGRKPLPDGRVAAVADLARAGLEALEGVPRDRGAATPAMRTGWRARGLLRRAARDPLAVVEGRLAGAEAGRRLSLMWRAARGVW